MEIKIELLESSTNAPMDLLLSADPSEEMIHGYLPRGKCYIATYNNITIGAMVLLKTRPHTMEVVNIAVKKEFQNHGAGKAAFEKIAKYDNRHIKWIAKENLKKNRLNAMDKKWAEKILAAVHTWQSYL